MFNAAEMNTRRKIQQLATHGPKVTLGNTASPPRYYVFNVCGHAVLKNICQILIIGDTGYFTKALTGIKYIIFKIVLRN